MLFGTNEKYSKSKIWLNAHQDSTHLLLYIKQWVILILLKNDNPRNRNKYFENIKHIIEQTATKLSHGKLNHTNICLLRALFGL